MLRRGARLLVDALPQIADGVVQVESDLGMALLEVGMGQVEEDGVRGQPVALGGIAGRPSRSRQAWRALRSSLAMLIVLCRDYVPLKRRSNGNIFGPWVSVELDLRSNS